MNILGIDIETYSETDLKKAGVYKYVADPSFEILLFAYKLNNERVQCIDLTTRKIPDEIIALLYDPNCIKTAWNVAFEFICLTKYLDKPLIRTQWKCTMIKASMLGLPMTLDQAGQALNLINKKDKYGSILIRYFTMPCKPTEKNDQRTRNLPEHDPEKWTAFIKYCIGDVHAEQEIYDQIKFFQVPPQEEALWQLDQEINELGILSDPDLIRKVIQLDWENSEALMAECIQITGIQNPKSVKQLLTWLQKEMPEEEIECLTKAAIPPMLAKAIGYSNEENIIRVLQIRIDLAKTSIKKYQAMVNCRGRDNRIRGLFQFYGANRTGRWAGRLVQMQNLPKNDMPDLDRIRRAVKTGNLEAVKMLSSESVPISLSQLIRTAFIPRLGHKFVVVDSSAIEARTSAWLAGEAWRLEVFKTHGKIYEASASKMFNIPFDKVSKDDRAKGKVAELALGYQGGINALKRMDGKGTIAKLAKEKFAKIPATAWEVLDEPMTEEKFVDWSYQEIVNKWRAASPAFKDYWYELNAAAIRVVRDREIIQVGYVKMFMERGVFFIQLPSGRRLSYLKPVIRKKIIKPANGEPFEVEGVAYMGVDQEKKIWGYQHTYGGKIFENLNQAIARDCLGYWMLKAAEKGFLLTAHVHDEIIIEHPEDKAKEALEFLIEMMSTEIPWAPGLPLAAAGFVADYYQKD